MIPIIYYDIIGIKQICICFNLLNTLHNQHENTFNDYIFNFVNLIENMIKHDMASIE